MKPVEIEQHDEPGHRGPAGCDADRPEAQEHDDDAREALAGLADDVRVRQVLHPLDRLEAGLERLCDLNEDRRCGSQIEHGLRVAVPTDDLSVDERGSEDERRKGHAQDESRADEPRCGIGTDDSLSHQVVPRPEPEQHAEDARDRPRSHQRSQVLRAERARDDERPGERHRPRDQLRPRKHRDVAPHPRCALGRAPGRRAQGQVRRSFGHDRSARARQSPAQIHRRLSVEAGDAASGSLERLFLRTFPESVCGSSVTNTTSRGTMKFSSRVRHSLITSSSVS